jgi:hypothetical protein
VDYAYLFREPSVLSVSHSGGPNVDLAHPDAPELAQMGRTADRYSLVSSRPCLWDRRCGCDERAGIGGEGRLVGAWPGILSVRARHRSHPRLVTAANGRFCFCILVSQSAEAALRALLDVEFTCMHAARDSGLFAAPASFLLLRAPTGNHRPPP